jgi:hypothetical protein
MARKVTMRQVRREAQLHYDEYKRDPEIFRRALKDKLGRAAIEIMLKVLGIVRFNDDKTTTLLKPNDPLGVIYLAAVKP